MGVTLDFCVILAAPHQPARIIEHRVALEPARIDRVNRAEDVLGNVPSREVGGGGPTHALETGAHKPDDVPRLVEDGAAAHPAGPVRGNAYLGPWPSAGTIRRLHVDDLAEGAVD